MSILYTQAPKATVLTDNGQSHANYRNGSLVRKGEGSWRLGLALTLVGLLGVGGQGWAQTAPPAQIPPADQVNPASQESPAGQPSSTTQTLPESQGGPVTVDGQNYLDQDEEAKEQPPMDPVMVRADALIRRAVYPEAFTELTRAFKQSAKDPQADRAKVDGYAERAAQIALLTSQYHALVGFSKQWRTVRPQSETALRYQAVALLELDDREAALRVWGDVLKIGYSDAKQGLKGIKDSLASVKNQPGALWVMQALASAHPDEFSAKLGVAQLALEVGNSGLAHAEMDRLLTQQAPSLDQTLKHEAEWLNARALVAMGDCVSGLSVAEALSVANTANERDVFLRGVMLSQCHRSEEALSVYAGLLRSKSFGTDVLVNLGDELIKLKRYSAAATCFQELIKRSREDAGHLGLAELAKETKRPVDAVTEYIKVNGNLQSIARIEAYSMLLDASQEELAQRLMDQYLEMNPDEAVGLVAARVEILSNHQKTAAAQALAERSLKSFPEQVTLKLALANALERNQKPQEALRLLQKLHEERPLDPDVDNALGFTFTDHQLSLSEARKLIDEALLQRPDSGAIIDSLGWWYYRNGQYDQARQTLEKAYAKIKDPENVWHLGQTWLALKQPDQAIKVYQEGLRFAPADQRLRQSLAALGVSTDAKNE